VTAEINSTCFDRCTLQKKTNVSALWMGAEIQDVGVSAVKHCLGFIVL